MTRTATGLGIAAALGFAVSLAAQTTTTTSPDQHAMQNDKGREVTVTGCLERGSDGTFMLNNARAGENSSTTTTAGTTGTTAAEPSSRASTTTAGAAMSYKLEGGKDLERHVGHEIQVTGHTDANEHSSMPSSSSSTTTATGTARSTTSGATLDVSSIKMISSSCK